jgi:tRNA A37 methylthiotransferase MiaB
LRDKGITDGLIDLIDKVEKVSPDISARILYLYPSTTSSKLISRIGSSPIFHNYFDMPIQHISNRMLTIMRRGIPREKIEELFEQMRGLEDSYIRTSFIIGHPGETEKDFEELVEYIESFRFDAVSIFQYSHEEGTASYNMDEVAPEIVEERMKIVESIVQKQRIENLKALVNRRFVAVIEKESDEYEYLLEAKPLHWADEIDGKVYINNKLFEEGIEFGKRYEIEITDFAGDEILLATAIKSYS